MKFLMITLMLPVVFSSWSPAQVAINTDGTPADNSAMLDVRSTGKGFLPPRMTLGEISVISSPANGLMVFCTTDNKLYVFSSSESLWKEILYGPGTIVPSFCSAFTDARDGKQYGAVLIGTQCWMAQNLNTGIRIDGSGDQTDNAILEKYCYNDDEANCDVYGGLYQWAEMVQYLNGASNTDSWNPVPGGNVQGICPAGWHLPSDQEWTTLGSFLGEDPGGKLKEAGLTHWLSPNTGATNSTGFTALPAGYNNAGSFQTLFSHNNIWSATEYSGSVVYMRNLYYNHALLWQGTMVKTSGNSVRCLMD